MRTDGRLQAGTNRRRVHRAGTSRQGTCWDPASDEEKHSLIGPSRYANGRKHWLSQQSLLAASHYRRNVECAPNLEKLPRSHYFDHLGTSSTSLGMWVIAHGRSARNNSQSGRGAQGRGGWDYRTLGPGAGGGIHSLIGAMSLTFSDCRGLSTGRAQLWRRRSAAIGGNNSIVRLNQRPQTLSEAFSEATPCVGIPSCETPPTGQRRRLQGH